MKFLVLLSIVVLSSSTTSAICVPGPITEIIISGDNITWVSNPNGCNVTAFAVDIYDSEDNSDLFFNVPNTELSMHLVLCKTYTFDIRAVTSESVSGPSNKVDVTTKLTAADNVGVKYTTITSTATTVVFNWELADPSVARCITGYKVVSWDEVNEPVNTEVTDPSFEISPTVSCMTYSLTVNAEVNEPSVTPPSSDGSIRASPSGPPGSCSLTKESIAADNAIFFFTVPSYQDYRCSFQVVLEVTGPGLNEKYTVNITDTADRTRVVQINVINLNASTVYEGKVWDENDAGQSEVTNFQFTTPAK